MPSPPPVEVEGGSCCCNAAAMACAWARRGSLDAVAPAEVDAVAGAETPKRLGLVRTASAAAEGGEEASASSCCGDDAEAEVAPAPLDASGGSAEKTYERARGAKSSSNKIMQNLSVFQPNPPKQYGFAEKPHGSFN